MCGAQSERIMSTFNTGSGRQSKNEKDKSAGSSGATGVKMEGGSASFIGGEFRNLQTGISLAKGAKVSIKDTKFKNVAEVIKVTKE